MKINEKKNKPWSFQDHPATPDNVVKLEEICSRHHCIFRKCSGTIKPRAITRSKVKYIMKDGKEVVD